MLIGALRLCLITGLWWAALWYALPLDLQAQSIPNLVGLHVAPPLLMEVAWFAFKHIRSRLAKRAEKRAKDSDAAQKKSAAETAHAARVETLRLRRAHAQCRAIWLEVPVIPDWLAETPEQCVLFERAKEEVQGAGSEAVLPDALQQMFEAVLNNKPLAWLPVYLIPGSHPGDDARRLAWLGQAWRKAAAVSGIEISPRCVMLPGVGTLAERVINLFESDADVPALILLGMDSPLAEWSEWSEDAGDDADAESDEPPPQNVPGHAIAAVLLSRPGLVLPEGMQIVAAERKKTDDYTPYWERGDLNADRSLAGWGGMPAKLLPQFMDTLKPFAALSRSRLTVCPHRGSLLALEDAMKGVLMDAGLLKMPEEGEKPAEAETPESQAAELPELGWLVYNSGGMSGKETSDRLARFAAGLTGAGCDLNVFDEANNLTDDFGDVGAAHEVVLLTVALILAAQLQKPALAAEFSNGDAIGIGLARPVVV
jgi:hypothetical protein